jgi:hypothetical protein
MIINDPNTLAEMSAQFAAYEVALNTNDVAALDGFFWNAAFAVRFGAGECLYGHAAIAAFRAARPPPATRRLQNTAIVTFADNFAVATTEFTRAGDARIGRQSQTWAKFPGDVGWRIVSAHVSWQL